MSQGDPTDQVLAVIASIRDQPESHREAEKAAVEESPIVPEMIEADGYQKVGPGPIAAIRFKWTVRRADDGDYFVDETVGENSMPIANGPMSKDAAIKFVDDRASEARGRFETLRNEMNGRAATALLVGKDSGET